MIDDLEHIAERLEAKFTISSELEQVTARTNMLTYTWRVDTAKVSSFSEGHASLSGCISDLSNYLWSLTA